jgi:hypothetical protein
MKDKILEEIKGIGVYGVLHYNETKRFYDEKYVEKENIYQYRISKIKVFLNENGNILGLQAFYKNLNGEEEAGAEGRDNTIKEYDIQTLEIPANDFLCNIHIFVGVDYITKLKFVTKKGKELEVGTNDGEDRTCSILNENKDKIVLCLSGGYRDKLELISCKYIPIKKYLGPTSGFFELKKKLKNSDFKKTVESKLSELDNSSQVLFRACCLPDNVFNEIIKFCLY